MRRTALRAAAAAALVRAAGAMAIVAALGACARLQRAPETPPPPVEEAAPAVAEAPADTAPPLPPQPEPPAPALPPPPPPLRAPATVRIGLATDLESVTLPCCDAALAVDVGGERLDVLSPLVIRPAAASVAGLSFRVQVAALREEVQAVEMARRIERLSGRPAEVRFDALGGLYRVRVGRHATKEEAEAAGRELVRYGVESFWVVTEGATLDAPALEVEHRGRTHLVPGRDFRFGEVDGAAVRWEGRRYRGRLNVYLNDRGRLNLINELRLEEYLRGVVPRELGPDAYPEIEALKAQAVAARSYTLRNLGEFAEEGYDLCGTPRCQVYGGMDAEHPLSDRAIAETAGQVMIHAGQPIDALYSATCGGHTENVEVIFPLKKAPYLRGVACIESGFAHLGTTGATAQAGAAAVFPRPLLRRALPDWSSSPLDATRLERALFQLARDAGLAVPADRLAGLSRKEVHRFLGSIFDLASDARLFVQPEELDYLVANPPPEWDEDDRRLAAWLVKSGLLTAPPAAVLAAREADELLLQLAIFLQAIEHRAATFSSVGNGELVVRDGATEAHYRLPSALATWRTLGGEPAAGALDLVAGDGLDLYLLSGELAAVVQHVDPRGASFDRVHNRTSWSRFKSDEELRKAVANRLPGFEFRTFEILSRGVSGRVGKIRLHGANAETIEVEGLPVRWTLDVPDTFFTARRLTPKSGKSGWQFAGRGWGHGVGLCQTGNYGMARRGHGAEEILTHYYSGATLATLEPAAN